MNRAAPHAAAFDLRPARADDYAFCEELYFASMQPLLTALDAWDQDECKAAFEGYFQTDEIRMILMDGREAGWIQVSETEDALHLDQIHLLAEFRCRGVGTHLIRELVEEARAAGKSVMLSLVRGNRVVNLYERLGFCLESEDSTRLHMRLGPG